MQSREGLGSGFICLLFIFLRKQGYGKSKTVYVNFIEEQFWCIMIMDFKILFGLFSFLVYKKSMFFVEIKENRKS